MWAASIFLGRATAQQVSVCSELSLTHARHSPCPFPPHSHLTQVESCPGNYPPTLRATGLEEETHSSVTLFIRSRSCHGSCWLLSLQPKSGCSRHGRPGWWQTGNYHQVLKPKKPGSAPRHPICNRLQMATSPGDLLCCPCLRICSARDN